MKFVTDSLYNKRYNRRDFRENLLTDSRTFQVGLNGFPSEISTLSIGSGENSVFARFQKFREKRAKKFLNLMASVK
jgi:hypothetical protein